MRVTLQKELAVAQDPVKVSWPVTKADWLRWLGNHQEKFTAALAAARAGCRNGINQRLQPSQQWPQGPSLRQWLPDATPQWIRLVKNGWYVATHGTSLFSWRVVCVPLQYHGTDPVLGMEQYALQVSVRLWDLVQPWERAIPATLWQHGTIHKVQMSAEFSEAHPGVLVLTPQTAVQCIAPPPVRRPRQSVARASSDEDEMSSDDSGDCSEPSDMPDSDQDILDLCSDLESALEDVLPERPENLVVENGSDSDGVVHRAPTSAFTTWRNGYFYIANYPDRPGVTIRMYPQFAVPGCLGERDVSRTITPSHYGELKEEHPQCMFLLRAWMLQRMRGSPSFMGHNARLRAYQREVDSLRRALHALGTASLLPRISAGIRSWAPESMQQQD